MSLQPMDLVGTKVRKTFDGFGTFAGTVESYDATAGYFKIQYEDGDSEEVDFEEISSILREMGEFPPILLDKHWTPGPQRSNCGRPKKRSRMDSTVCSNSLLYLETGVEKVDSCETLGEVEGTGERKRRRKERKGAPLRRSTRRASAVKRESENANENEDVLFVSQDEELGGSGGGEREGFILGKKKLELPPSSNDLDVEGLNVVQLFAVYTCLRSFSRSLFLSPFELGTFVRALRCANVNLLIDSIHFSILQTLKKHLGLLSEEGSPSASACLRYLNWELLDFVTWPVFLVQYLSLHRSVVKPGFRLSQLKLLDLEYYEQPAGVKLEILQCLCDDVIEVDAIRSELSRRLESEVCPDATFISKNYEKKRKGYASIDPGTYTGQQVAEEVEDGNSDECCLCGMDGSLICCDGCPAAFHSRCVGVVKDLLPEGEWYCPECVVEKSDGLVLSKLSKGAELLGLDPDRRLYFCSCDHLLVSDSCETEVSFHYYSRNDLGSVVKVLKTRHDFAAIVNAIFRYWGIPIDAYVLNDPYGNNIPYIHKNVEPQVQIDPLFSTEDDLSSANAVQLTIEKSASEQCEPKMSELSDSVQLNSVNSLSEPLDGKDNVATSIQLSDQTATDFPVGSFLPFKETASGSEKCNEFPNSECMTDIRNEGDPYKYINYYIFGRIASSVFAELMHKSTENNNNDSDQDIKSAQVKAISNKFTEGCWYTCQNLYTDAHTENCGWCFSCKISSDSDCLFRIACDKNLEGFKEKFFEGPKSPTDSFFSGKNKKNHITSAIQHILSIENCARGLLSGLWEKPHYSQHWRDAVVNAADVAALRPLLLILELNLRRIALSLEWSKPVNDPRAIVSTSIVTSLKAKTADICWWRGGKLSRQLFQCKMLPRALAFKSVRQAGGRKIPHLSYPDGLDFAKRSKYVSWRVAVETSQNVAQLIYQVKDFDSNIKWAELSDTRLFPPLAKESKKSKPVKKVTIRRKCKEGKEVKYLLDFGKRERVPSIVTKHGVLFEESSNGKKSYWLNETYVPLNLLKSFEERKISLLLKKADSGTHIEKHRECKIRKRDRSEWLSYLVSRELESEKQPCGHCTKDVLVREAVTCQFCNGLFHRKHFRVPKGAIATSFTCSKCKDTKSVNVKAKGIKSKDTQSVNVKAKAIKTKKLKDKDVKMIDVQDKEVRSKNGKDKDKKTVKGKYKDVKSPNAMVQDTKSCNFNDKGRRNVKIKPIQLRRSLRVRAQGHKIVLIIKNISKGKRSQATSINLQQGLAKGKEKFNGYNRSTKGKSKVGKSENFENWISWPKTKRSVVHYSYWLNGLRWTHEPVTELQRSTQRIVFLPSQHMVDTDLKPLCSLCLKDYNPGVIYLRCEKCHDWFHGDAFCHTVENINNLIGFRCHNCRMRSAPVCPFVENALVGDVGLDFDCETELNVVNGDHQNSEDKLCGGFMVLNEGFSNEEQNEVQNEEQRDNAFVVNENEDHLDEVEDVLLYLEEELDSNPQTLSTSGYIAGVENMSNDKNTRGGGSEILFQSLNLLDENDRENVPVLSEEGSSLHARTSFANVGGVQSLQQLEENLPSMKNEKRIEVGPALCDPGEGFCRITGVPDSQVIDQHSDSHVLNPQITASTPSLEEVEVAKTLPLASTVLSTSKLPKF